MGGATGGGRSCGWKLQGEIIKKENLNLWGKFKKKKKKNNQIRNVESPAAAALPDCQVAVSGFISGEPHSLL